MKLLSVGLVNHDTNFSFYDSGKVKYHKLERSFGSKRFVLFPITNWKDHVKSIFGIDPSEVDDIIFQFDPTTMIPQGLRSLIRGDDKSLCTSLHPLISKYLGINGGHIMNHHYSHALSSWMIQDRKDDVSVVIDGLGDGRPWSVFRDDRLIAYGDISKGSLGWEMRDAGKALGISFVHQNDIAGKLMGLQAYGKLNYGFLEILSQDNMEAATSIFDFSRWIKYVGNDLLATHTRLDWIRTVHECVGDKIVEFFRKYVHSDEVVSYSGGVAQNVIWNTKIKNAFPKLIIPPHASDEGTSLGGLGWLFQRHNIPKPETTPFPFMQTDQAPLTKVSEKTIITTSKLLAEGNIVGWYQGNGEVGPRALGARSILMDPRLVDGKRKINEVKRRETYRPFGASVLQDHFEGYFDGPADPFMLYTAKIKKQGFLDAITHLDGSCRVQLVNPAVGPLYGLLRAFYEETGCPILLNTSLNLAGRPIAGYPQEALTLLNTTNMDFMVIGDKIYRKEI